MLLAELTYSYKNFVNHNEKYFRAIIKVKDVNTASFEFVSCNNIRFEV